MQSRLFIVVYCFNGKTIILFNGVEVERKNIWFQKFHRGLNTLRFRVYQPRAQRPSSEDKNRSTVKRSLVCEIRRWKITGALFFQRSPVKNSIHLSILEEKMKRERC